jgi:TM2 domain-containing membrane protein YozV
MLCVIQWRFYLKEIKVPKTLFFFSFLLLLSLLFNLKAASAQTLNLPVDSAFISICDDASLESNLKNATSNKLKLITLLQKATVENKRVTAAILTITLGMLGVHRIYLGTAPYIPAVYLFTFGGGFFILPLIDLVMIIAKKDISTFENNDSILMWIKE